MKIPYLVIALTFMSVCAFSQSKLIKAGQATTVGTTASKTSSNPTTIKQPTSKSTPTTHPVTTTKPYTSSDPNQRYASTGYMEITGMDFANVDNSSHIIGDYGSSLYASELKFLSPKVYYRGLASVEKEVSLDIKIYDANGSLKTGTNSSDGYTTSCKVTIQPGVGRFFTLVGWGTSKGGSYEAGQYRYEIWYRGNLLFQKSIRLLYGSTPIVSDKNMRISSVSFSNQDYEGNTLTSSDKTLYAGDVQFLCAKLFYYGLCSSSQEMNVMYRIFDPDGDLIRGNSSPLGFSNQSKVSISPGSNSVNMLGFGSKSGATYKKPGTYTMDFWLDGEKIYETTVTLVKKPNAVSYLTIDGKEAVATTYGSSGGNEVFYVRTDADSWSTWGIPSWCEVTNKTATSFTLICKPNNTGSSRKDYMKINAGDKSVRIDITQY